MTVDLSQTRKKEQFHAANCIIRKQNSDYQGQIDVMDSEDKLLANQIIVFNAGLRSLATNLRNTRDQFKAFAAETKSRGKQLMFELEKGPGCSYQPTHFDIT